MSGKGKKEAAGKKAAAPAKGSDKGSKVGKAGAKGGAKKERKPSWRITLPLYEKHPKNFSIGNDILPKGRDLTRFVKWPKRIRIQRQKRILQERLKVPPAIAQFRRVLGKNNALALFKLLHKYQPETALERKQRLTKLAEAKAKGESLDTIKRPLSVVSGINAVTTLVERDQAKLVVIAHDVDPVELVLWLPTLLRKKDVPYVIVKDKSRLGRLVHRKTCAVVALPEPRKEDKTELGNIVTIARERYNDNVEHRRQWGGGKLGPKARARIERQKRLIAKEQKMREKAAAR
jgi:large subunit ribosomal protein L7Ae